MNTAASYYTPSRFGRQPRESLNIIWSEPAPHYTTIEWFFILHHSNFLPIKSFHVVVFHEGNLDDEKKNNFRQFWELEATWEIDWKVNFRHSSLLCRKINGMCCIPTLLCSTPSLMSHDHGIVGVDGADLQIPGMSKPNTTFISNCSSFNFFYFKFGHLSYSKILCKYCQI